MDGIDKLSIKLDNIKSVNLEQALARASIIVENQAKINCPVDMGSLRNSITHTVQLTETGGVAKVGSNMDYAPYVEIGTGIFSSEGNGRQDRWCYQTPDGEWHSTIGNKPQPYLQPALHDSTKMVIDELKKALGEAIDNA